MPVRIYEISKKLGVESKKVLAKAKELGITGAKVASSSLDKITAEYLEQQLESEIKATSPPPPVVEPTKPEPILVVKAPEAEPDEPTKAAESQVEPAPVADETQSDAAESEPAQSAEPAIEAEDQQEEIEEPPVRKETPRPPPGPKVGDKVGFIKLPDRPVRGRAADTRRDRAADRPDVSRERHDTRGGRGGFAAGRRGVGHGRPDDARKPAAPSRDTFTPPDTDQIITLKSPIVVRELAEKLNRKPFQVIADLMEMNVFATVNQAIDELTAKKVCGKYGFRFELEKRERGAGVVHPKIKKPELDKEDKPGDLLSRAPVVTIMGHVDHGKTTLLDVIRKTDVVSGEAGGITQHIGAYTISFPHPERKGELQQITFLDTPGHAAFSAMRARGANVTDIVILVVAANDGVMPQTIEALNHAKAAQVPIIVAVNKCDLPGANPMRARQQLQERGLVPDDWGGDTIFVDVSATTKQGVDKLLEMVLLQADLLELKANPNRRATGNVIESGLEPGGPTATVLVRKGTLRVGDPVLCGQFYGKVRALIDEEGNRLKVAGPSVAVRILGLNGVPEAGVEFSALEHEKEARELGGERQERARLENQEARSKVTLENLFDRLAAGSAKVLRVVVKADTQGSVEAIVEALHKIDSEKVSLEVIHSAVGTITESDVLLASASSAIILGFHTRIDSGVSDVAKREGIQIKLYSIIYELIEEVKDAMAGLLDPILKETVTGEAEVRKVFDLSKGAPVAGCIVNNGRITRGKVRVMRQKNLIYEGGISSLRRFQDEVNEVRAGMECGIRVDGFGQFAEGDTIECYSVEKIEQKL
jgi:translation initiation factor IF-2